MITRFAPSPTGPLHLGHAYSAITAYELAQSCDGQFILRIEDIDKDRSKPEWERQIFDDLHWLGIRWPKPVLRQSENMAAYQEAISKLAEAGYVYACSCNRKDILAAQSAPQEGDGPLFGPDGAIYPGTCRGNRLVENPDMNGAALRLDLNRLDPEMRFRYVEHGTGQKQQIGFTVEDLKTQVGDFVLSRRGIGTSYHLSVVLDDAVQGVTHVVRGDDLREATMIHVLLQSLLGLPTPTYCHHKLVRDAEGKRLAKRDDARAIALFRKEGLTPAQVIQRAKSAAR